MHAIKRIRFNIGDYIAASYVPCLDCEKLILEQDLQQHNRMHLYKKIEDLCNLELLTSLTPSEIIEQLDACKQLIYCL